MVQGLGLAAVSRRRSTPAMREAFLAAYLEAIKPHYPAQHDGQVLLPFPRVFIVAVR